MGCDLLMTAAVNEDKTMGDVVDVCTGDESLSMSTVHMGIFANVLKLFTKDAKVLASNATFPHFREMKYCVPMPDDDEQDEVVEIKFMVFFPGNGVISDRIEVTINGKFVPLSLKFIDDAAEAVENFSRDLTMSN
ncbi:hypothetical protein [Bacteroides sp.]|uniref:hypothetical protein n=1 Tax=Bacteroides sp. TaxID=29523 RepID=UPI00261E1E6C|nr:hypothetical protein [Bacteroides sp.]MDD3038907.1 hypothetical protein [Bacteroides sp.]